jgi:hypothetical protein
MSLIVEPVLSQSKRICAVQVNNGENVDYLLVNIYMPVNDHANSVEYLEVLNELRNIMLKYEGIHIIIAGDLNIDFTRSDRNNICSQYMKDFLETEPVTCCSLTRQSEIGYTYKSKINAVTSFIDHFIVSLNLCDNVNEYYAIDDVDNFSFACLYVITNSRCIIC